MIEALSLTKRHGSRLAVDDLAFTVPDGAVTGLLGPAGSGKSTVLRLAVGLDRGEGEVLFDGAPLARAPRPAEAVGAALEPRALHPGRTARSHLRVLAAGAGVPRARVDEVLERTGLTGVAHRRPGVFWRGAAQRLAVAGALLGRPRALLLDDPLPALDVDGAAWLRSLLREHAAGGGSALLSGSSAAAIAPLVDSLLVLRRGRLVAHGATDEVLASASAPVLVRASDPGALAAAVLRWGGRVEPLPDGALVVGGLDIAAVGEVCRAEGIAVHELTRRAEDLDASLADVVLPPTDLLRAPAVSA